jgi:hypothetical protein
MRHNDPSDEYCLDLHTTYVLGHDTKDIMMLAMIIFNLLAPHFVLNAVRAIETGWGTLLNGYATFGFCRTNIYMIVFGFKSMVSVNNSACWSFFSHQADLQKAKRPTCLPFMNSRWLLLPISKPILQRNVRSLRVS